jgi:TctA family transporter
MMQLYFLSITTNLLAGTALCAEYFARRLRWFAPLGQLAGGRGFRVVVGALAAAVGFLKLLVRSAPNDVPVVGDLLPALAGLAMGASLLVQVLREKADLPAEAISGVEKAALAYRVPLGLAGLAVALLHFLLPGALFL